MISKYYVQLDQKDLARILNALDRVKKSTYEWTYNEMPKRGATKFLLLLKSNIISQRYSSLYNSLSPGYAEWKGELDKFWLLKGDFLRSLSAFRSNQSAGILEFGGGQWMAGVPAGVRDSGGKSWFYPRSSDKQKKHGSRSIATYAYYGEFGHGGKNPQPARPIFVPTLIEYEKDGWPKQGDDALKYIGRQWR